MAGLTAKPGFAAPMAGTSMSQRNSAGVALFASATLAICLVVAVTAVSIGMARARTLGAVLRSSSAPVAFAVDAVMDNVSGLSALARREPGSAATGLGPYTD